MWTLLISWIWPATIPSWSSLVFLALLSSWPVLSWVTVCIWRKVLHEMNASGRLYSIDISSTNLKQQASFVNSRPLPPTEAKAVVVLVACSTILLAAIAYKMYFPRTTVYEDWNLRFSRVVAPNVWETVRPDGTKQTLEFCPNIQAEQEYNPLPGFMIEHIRADWQGCLRMLPGSFYRLDWAKDENGWWKKDDSIKEN